AGAADVSADWVAVLSADRAAMGNTIVTPNATMSVLRYFTISSSVCVRRPYSLTSAVRKSSMGDVEAAPCSSFTPVAPLAWSKLVPDVDLPDLGAYQNLGRAHTQVLSSSAKELSL